MAFNRTPVVILLPLLMAGALLAWWSFVTSEAAVHANDAPLKALEWQQDNAAALRSAANGIVGQKSPQWSQVARLARRSLARSVVNAEALRELGQAVEAAGNDVQAEALVRAALGQSRREAAAHLWLVAHISDNTDIEAAVHHLDMALRVEPALHETLFPLLIMLSEDPVAQRYVFKAVRSNPSWFRSFAVFGDGRAETIVPFARLVAAAGGLGDMRYGRRYEQTAITTLLRGDHYSVAKALYQHLDGARQSSLTTLAFPESDGSVRYAPLDWTFDPSGAFDVLLDRSGKNPVINITVKGPATGTVASKISFFTPGRYVFRTPPATGDVDENLTATWLFRCLTDNAGAGPAVEITATTRGGSDVPLVMDPECKAQRLDLKIRYEGGQNLRQLQIPAPELIQTDK